MMMSVPSAAINRLYAERIRIRGLVQGVGFRPHVWQCAQLAQLIGTVCNDGDGVLIEIWGESRAAIEQFCRAIQYNCPPLAHISAIERQPLDLPAPAVAAFTIITSVNSAIHTGIIPDAALCDACRADIIDPTNRRAGYPFTNCTHCGPRFSIIHALPYDRANTSMAVFNQCPACAAEYSAPNNRRFHAQPNACPHCGPRVWVEYPFGTNSPAAMISIPLNSAVSNETNSTALAQVQQLLARGDIVAIKGIGGFHLACDAGNATAVATLRQRKHRPTKPLALMARDLDMIARYCHVSSAEAAVLTSAAAPIVLLQRLPTPPTDTTLALTESIAPNQDQLGFMLPYSPLHWLLLANQSRPLVMTSANRSAEPQLIDHAAAHEQLDGLADAFLLHDRAIVNRVDDSVVRLINGTARLLRRARGYAPAPLWLSPQLAAAQPVLALGAELKHTFCLLAGQRALLSPHLGDLNNNATLTAFEQMLARYQQLFGIEPAVIAIDAHPDYHSSHWGRELAARAQLPLITVQHHHAHIAAVLAEHDSATHLSGDRRNEMVLGWALDGLGYGADGQLWGGELLLANYHDYTRVAQLKPVALPGGEQAATAPWRNLVAQLDAAGLWSTVTTRWAALPAIKNVLAQPVDVLLTMIQRGINSPRCSSAGRLFDAVAALLLPHLAAQISYEGQAAMALETMARPFITAAGDGYDFAIETDTATNQIILNPAPLWAALLTDLAANQLPGLLAARFHTGLARALINIAAPIAATRKIDTLVIAGGVLQNQILLEQLAQRGRAFNWQVLAAQQVPSHDGGIALGQAVIAALSIQTGGCGDGLPM